MVKNPPASAGDASLIPGFGRFPGGGNGNPLQSSHLGNPMDQEAWRATVHGAAKSQTQLGVDIIASMVCVCQPQPSRPPLSPSGTIHLFSVSAFLLCQ